MLNDVQLIERWKSDLTWCQVTYIIFWFEIHVIVILAYFFLNTDIVKTGLSSFYLCLLRCNNNSNNKNTSRLYLHEASDGNA